MDEYTEFIKDCASLHDTLWDLQQLGVKENVSEESAFKAQYILKMLKIIKLGDAFLFAAAVNTLYAFASASDKNKSRLGEEYKSSAGDLCSYLAKNPECGMIIELHEENGKNVMYTEISKIQFSYGRIAVDERTAPYYIPDAEMQKLIPDKLYEQKLSETLLSFALKNTKLREGLTTNGKDFDEMLDHALEMYRSGKLRLEDLLSHDQQKADLNAQLSAFFEQTNAVLYESSYGSFHQALTERTFMPYIAENFKQQLGYSMSAALYAQGKYALETLRALMVERGNVSSEIGVQLGYMRTQTDEHFYLLIMALVNEVPACGVIQLYGWECMEPTDSNGIIRFRYQGQPEYSETFHPALQGILLYEYLKLGCIYDWNHLKMSSFFYDTARKPSAEVALALKGFSDHDIQQPLYYAPEGLKLLDSMSDILSGEPVSRLQFEKKQEKISGYLLDYENELALLVNAVQVSLKNEKSALFMVTWRMSSDVSAVSKVLSDSLSTLSEVKTYIQIKDGMETAEDTDVLIHLGYFPSSMDFSRITHQIVIVDSTPYASAANEAFLSAAEEIQKQEVFIHAVTFSSSLGYSDGGAGFDWLVKLLHLGVSRNQIWDRRIYPIIIRDNHTAELMDGIAQITIPSYITTESIHAQDWKEAQEREKLYHELRNGVRGVSMVIENPELRLEAQQTLESYCESISRVFAGDIEVCSQDESFPSNHGTTAQNMARDNAVRALGTYAWRMLHEQSRDWVVSALISYDDMMRIGQSLDYSGVNLLLSKAFEVEGQRYLAEGYKNYMREKYGDDYLKFLPSEMVNQKEDGSLSAVRTDYLTIGSFIFIMGFDLDAEIANQTDYDHFAAYAEDVLLRDKNDVYNQLHSLTEILIRVCLSYRDTAAHAVSTDAQKATECVNYCVLEERKLGVMMDCFR